MSIHPCLAIPSVAVLSLAAAASAGEYAPETAWLREARFGAFMHFLPGDPASFARVEAFDVSALTEQLASARVRYFVLTLGQNSGYFNAPNAVYDRVTGYAAGERCSARDLPMELADALAAKGIRFMLYLPCQTPNRDAKAQAAFGLEQGPKDQPIDADFARRWAEVIAEWSVRYGDRVSGWWFDGGYEWVGFNDEIAAIYREAVKRGNPEAIATFNPGVKLVRWSAHEDYTAGELNDPLDVVPTGPWVEGSQWHALTFAGASWGSRDVRYTPEAWTSWARTVGAKGGALTVDVGPNYDPAAGPVGTVSAGQLALLTAIGDAVRPAEAAPEFYVSPVGNDAWSGRLPEPNAAGTDGPFAGVPAAQRAVRALRAAQTDRETPVIVAVRGGTYSLAEPLRFGPADSGTELSPVVYGAYGDERPVFSGGRRITDWEVSADGRWHADLPEVKFGEWSFTQLFVDDQRRFRPVLPEQGYYRIAREEAPSPAAEGKGHDRFGFAGDDIRGDWENPGDVEVFAFHFWAGSRLRIAAVDSDTRTVTLQGRTTGSDWWAQLKKDHRYRVENVKEALRRPGQWYLDRPSGRLTYIPRPGETPQGSVVVAPRLPHLLLLAGDAGTRDRVRHLQFRGLTFAHANWTTPSTGQSFPQAEINLGAAIAAVGARHVVFEDCAVRHVGEYGMGFGAGCRYNRVSGCEIVDVGAGGIKIGSALPGTWGDSLSAPSDDEMVVSHHTVEDCLIAHAGRLHPAGIGVWVGHSAYNTVRFNDVYDLYYSAFSLGWVWGYGPSRANHNEVGFNHAHHIGQGVLSDMGCIYTLGISPGTVIRDNRFHDVESYDYGGWGLYTDEGSTGVIMRNNLVYRCSRGGFHQHYGKENRVENNIFAFGGEHQIQRTRTEDHTSFFFERNIVLWDNDSPLFGSNWKDDHFVSDRNLYWHGGKEVTFPGGLTLDAWRETRGHDADSLIADPGFADAAADDFRLGTDSPALAVGFVPFDPDRAGRRKPVRLTANLPDVPPGFDGK